MKPYRVRQEGYWFYPQYRCLATWFRWTTFQKAEIWWEVDVYFNNLTEAKAYIAIETAPAQKAPKPKPIIHPYP